MLIALLLACPSPAPVDSAAPAEDAVTYYRDVRPILDDNCTRCHTEGGIAWSMEDAATAQSMASAISTAVTEGRMPPPAPDVACHDYQDSARFVLDESEKATLLAWAEAGGPLGDAADAPAEATNTLRTLAPYDQELIATLPYTPSFRSDGNDYRCFLLDVGNSADTYIRGMQAIIDNPSIVHHVVLFQPDRTDDLWADGDPHEGFTCGGLGQANWQTLGAWAPGTNPTVLPDGMGIPLPADSQLVLQMHYYNSFDGADQESDQSGYGLLYTDSVEWEGTNYAFGPTSFSIDAGDEDGHAQESYSWPIDAKILAAWPHMHLKGSAFEETVRHSDGTEDCLLRMNDWDFHNQVTANFLEPYELLRGDKLKVSCHWDNADGTEEVSFGEGTQDEMCFGFTLVAMPAGG